MRRVAISVTLAVLLGAAPAVEGRGGAHTSPVVLGDVLEHDRVR